MAIEPFVWPEQAPPAAYANCADCELSLQRKRVIWGEGNPQGRLLVLLDNPGAREDAAGQPFVCGTRLSLQTAAYEAGFMPDDLFVTYVVKCRPIRKYDKAVCRSACMAHLSRQLAEQNPELVFCMGNVAVQSFWNDPEAEVKTLRGQIHLVGGRKTAVTYHPLAVRRRPNLYKLFMQDWQLAASFLGINT